MFQINWKIKSLLFRFLNFFNLYEILFLIQKKISKTSDIKLEEIIFYWDIHYKYLKENKTKSLIEIGAGKSLAQNIYLSYMFDQEVEQTLIDVSKMLDLDLFNKANEQISNILRVNRLPFARSIEDLKKNFNLNYLAPMTLKQINDENLKFDACISSTTLEHLPKKELVESFYLLKSIVKSNGVISAVIDYSDHYSHTDTSISNLNFLRFSEDQWKKYNTKMLFQNRLRHQDYREIFKKIGFTIFEIKGDYGKYPELVSEKFNSKDKETSMLWGYYLLKFNEN